MWSYKLGLQNGYMPTDPRQSIGKCGGQYPVKLNDDGLGHPNDLISETVRQRFEWPPSIRPGNWDAVDLPQYTQTGAIPTLPVASLAPTQTASAGGGWFDLSDVQPIYTPISGCGEPSQ